MFKPLITLLTTVFLLIFSGFTLSQQSVQHTQVNRDRFQISPTFQPTNPRSVFTTLWWFGDGGYKIVQSQAAAHSFHNPSRIKTNFASSSYKIFGIVTENYGNTGPPPVVGVDIDYGSLSQPFVASLPKILNGATNSNYIDIRNYRDAVLGDIVYFIVTYGNPEGGNVLNPESYITLDFGEHSDDFEYAMDDNTRPSFLAHCESFAGNTHGLRWNIGSPINPGEERSMLLPFRYTGSEKSGSFPVLLTFHHSDLVPSPIFTAETTSIAMKFSGSHDPNRIEVTPENTDCVVGGKLLNYDIHFQNVGEKETRYVKVEVSLDEMHDLSTIHLTRLPHGMSLNQTNALAGFPSTISNTQANYWIDQTNHKVIFEFHNLVLSGLCDTLLNDPATTRDMFSFEVKVKNNYVIGEDITAEAAIIFDQNDPVITNVAITTCPNPASANEEPSKWCSCWVVYILLGIIVLLLLLLFFRRKKRKK